MLKIIGAIAAGIAGAALFAAIDHYFLTLPKGYSYLGAVIVFALFSGIAYLAQRGDQDSPRYPRRKLVVGSKNKSGGKMKIAVTGVRATGDGETSVGSGNKSADDMSVKVTNR